MPAKPLTIAIDGYSSCGKSTLAKALAQRLGYAYIDSGAMYRAVTLYFLNYKIDIKSDVMIADALDDISIVFKRIDGENTTWLNGSNVEREIRDMRVSNYVSEVSTISAVRRALVKMQRAMGQLGGIVMDGRDIGTVVFPHAEVKIFMTADIEIRTRRRLEEMRRKGDDTTDLEAVKLNLTERDRIDSTREDSPLRKAADAFVIDNSHLTQEEQLQQALNIVHQQSPSTV